MIKWTAMGMAFVVGTLVLGNPAQDSRKSQMPFGDKADMSFAKELWTSMKGYQDWKLTTEVFKGMSPHGKWVRLYSTFVRVGGKMYPIIVKDNYGGRGVSKDAIAKDPAKWLKAVTAMVQRRPGYDKANQDWFYVKYGPTGEVAKNEKGMSLAGRVAKGMKKGCISCHSQAGGDDFLYSND